MEEDDDMEVQPASLTVKEKQEVRDLVACLLKQRLGKLGNLVTRYLDGHGSMRNYMPFLHMAAENMRFLIFLVQLQLLGPLVFLRT